MNGAQDQAENKFKYNDPFMAYSVWSSISINSLSIERKESTEFLGITFATYFQIRFENHIKIDHFWD